MIILLVHNENWPQANLHVMKENKSFKKRSKGGRKEEGKREGKKEGEMEGQQEETRKD